MATQTKISFDTIDVNIRDIQDSISNFHKVELDSDDFYQKMIELNHSHPDAYELIQAMIMLFSKMETSNKQFKENVIDYSIKGLELKKNAMILILEQDNTLAEVQNTLDKCKLIEATIQEKLASCTPKRRFKFWEHMGAYAENPKNFGKILLAGTITILFSVIIVMEALKPVLLHNSLNSVTSIIKGDYIKKESIHKKEPVHKGESNDNMPQN